MAHLFRPIAYGLLASGLLVGCTARDRDDAIDQGASITKHVVNSTVSAASKAWDRASAEAKRLTPDSGREALESAKRGLEEAKDKLQPGKRVDEAEAEIARLRAALDIDKLRLEMDAKVAEARRLKENADKSAAEVRRQLAAADQAYRDLNERLAAAQDAYDAARRKVDAIAESIRD